MKIRTLIVDDEPLARERIKTLLKSDPDVEVIGECAGGRKAVTAIQKQAPDLVFLDVQMPELDGFGVLQAIENQPLPAVIFVTAHDQYALKAFEVHAQDYLLKPFDRERFQKALGRAKARLELEGKNLVLPAGPGGGEKTGELSQRLLALLEHLRAGQEYLERLVVKSQGRIYFLKTDEIDWIESAGNYVRVHVARESHLIRETMNTLEAKLDPKKFLRVHRSTLVNIERIKELHPMFRGDHLMILRDGTRLTLSRGYRGKLQELLGKPV